MKFACSTMSELFDGWTTLELNVIKVLFILFLFVNVVLELCPIPLIFLSEVLHFIICAKRHRVSGFPVPTFPLGGESLKLVY